jgi:hypothetical protein
MPSVNVASIIHVKNKTPHAQHSAIADRVFGFAGAVFWMNRGYRSPAAQAAGHRLLPVATTNTKEGKQ